MAFFNIYSSFSCSQIRCLQFAFRVLLSESSSNIATSSTNITGAINQSITESFFHEFFQDQQTLIQSAWQSTPPPVVQNWIDLHEWITLIFHIRTNADTAAASNSTTSTSTSIVRRILQGAREVQHQRTEVAAGQSVASEKQLLKARREVEYETAKDTAINSQTIHGLRPYYISMFSKYDTYFETVDIDTTPNNPSCATVPTTTSLPSAPILDNLVVLHILEKIGFWKFNNLVEEEFDRLIELRTKNRQDEQDAILQYSADFSQEQLWTYIVQFRDMDEDDGTFGLVV